MSTQRRESRWQRISCTGSGVPDRQLVPNGVQRAGRLSLPSDRSWSLGWLAGVPGPIARWDCASADGRTAPPGIQARLATNSLQMGNRIVKLVQFVFRELRHSSPPFRAGLGEETGTPANHGSSLPHILPPSSLARLHPPLPRVPAGRRRWAERYDGKGNMHLQHAA